MKTCSSFSVVSFIAIAASVPLIHACHGTKSIQVVQSIDAKEAMGKIQNGFAILVDVRERDEVKEGIAAPAQWFPYSKVTGDNPEWVQFQKSLPKNKEVIFYCQAGGRANKAAELLAAQGFSVSNLGGFDSWKKEGFPVKKLDQ